MNFCSDTNGRNKHITISTAMPYKIFQQDPKILCSIVFYLNHIKEQNGIADSEAVSRTQVVGGE